MSGQPVTLSPQDLIFRRLLLRGFWLGHWRRETPAADQARAFQDLAELVVKGAISAPVEATYPLEEFADAFAHTGRSERSGKVLFRP